MKAIDVGLIELFDQYLYEKGISYKASIIGGVAIMLIANHQRSTGDIDSLQKIPKEVYEEIVKFAKVHQLEKNWFNDHVARNFHEFVRKGENIFETCVYDGKALKLFTPSIKTLLLSKIYPILDRPEEGKDLQDIEALIKAKVVTHNDLEAAIKAFEDNIRFEDDIELRTVSWELVSLLRACFQKIT